MPSLPTVTSDIPRDLRQFLERVRENINGRGEDELVTVRKLVAAGIADYTGGTLASSTGGTYYATPPAPTGVAANGALANVIITWDQPNYNGHAYTEIWAAQQTAAQANADPEKFPDLGEAELVGMAPGAIWVHNIGGGGSRWYWLRYINVEGQEGPYNAVNGTRGDTATDPSHLIDLLSGQISASELATSLSDRIDLIDGADTLANSVAARIASVQGQVNELLNLPEWSSTETYAIDDQVVYEGFLYVAVAASTDVEPGPDSNVWDQIGEYATIGDAVAAHTVQIGDLETDLGQEVTDRTTLATQLRGNYTGNEIALVSGGLIQQERIARSNADSTLASDITTLSAFANTKSRVFYQTDEPVGTTDNPLNIGDLWIDTDITYAADYVEGDYVIQSNRMYRYDGTNWVEAMDFGFADWFTAIRSEKQARVDEDEALAESITTLTSATNNSLSTINTTLGAHASDIGANSQSITTLTATVTANNNTLTSAIQTEESARSSADATNAQAITTLESQVEADIAAAVATEASTRASADGNIEAKYTVKVDLAGHVSGYGLIADNNDEAPVSEFGIRADQFWLAPPANNSETAPTDDLFPGYVWVDESGEAPITKYYTGVEETPWSTNPQNLPFIVRTSSATINGETVSPGVYIADAFIQNGTITNAKIGDAEIDNAKIANLDAAKITSGFISSDRIAASSITASMIDSSGLSIKDADGTVILAAGTPLSVSNIEGLGTLAQFSEITLEAISDVGALAALDEVTQDDLETDLVGKIDGKVESYFQDADDDPSADWESAEWSSTETYAADDQVVYDGFLYVAVAASTNEQPDLDTDNTYWQRIGADERTLHLGDLWWQTDTNTLHRYKYYSVNGGYSWEQITDQKATDAYANAATAQDTADSKRRVFVAQPTVPYDVGDLWDRGATTGIWRCKTAKAAIEDPAWGSNETYTTGDQVVHQGSPYVCLVAENTGTVPGTDATVWEQNSEVGYAGTDWQQVADTTSQNTAAAITNQGNLATVNYVGYTNMDSDLQGLVDGKVESYFQDADDDPSEAWTTASDKDIHLGDLWWQTDTDELYRWRKYVEADETIYEWQRITDSVATNAFANAATAQGTADGKRRVFVNTPEAPYDIGDLWDRGSTDGLWRCITARATDYEPEDPVTTEDDWQVVADRTADNTAAGIENQGSLATLSEVAYGSLAATLATLIDGKAEQHYGTSDPSDDWEDEETKDLHINDTWYHTTDKLLYVYRAGDDPATQGTEETHYWEKVENQDAIDAASAASAAQDTADGKRRVFVAKPAPPYDIGDLWDRGDQAGGGIWRCNVARATGYTAEGEVTIADDWQVVADATLTGTAAAIKDQGDFATLDQITDDNVSTYIAAAAITNAYIGDVIQSASYRAADHEDGPAGWKIDKDAGMEMKDATFFGTLDIDEGSGSRLVIKSDRIEVWEGETLRVRMGNLNPS